MTAPTTLDVAAAARYVVTCELDANREASTRNEAAYFAALDIWEALTGLSYPDALAYARQAADTQQRAALIPF